MVLIVFPIPFIKEIVIYHSSPISASFPIHEFTLVKIAICKNFSSSTMGQIVLEITLIISSLANKMASPISHSMLIDLSLISFVFTYSITDIGPYHAFRSFRDRRPFKLADHTECFKD
jgi:hypothetical protein